MSRHLRLLRYRPNRAVLAAQPCQPVLSVTARQNSPQAYRGLSAAFVVSFALLLFGGFGVLLLVIALLAILVTGARYGFKIIERSSKGFLRPSDYPLTNDDLVSEYLPYKYAAMNLVLGVLVTLLQVITGGSEFIAILAWLVFFVAISPAATMRLVITGTLRGALNPSEMISLIQRIGKPYAALVAFIFVAELCRSYGLAALGCWRWAQPRRI